MPLTSAFTPPGHFAFSSKPSHAESIYRTLKDNFGKAFSVEATALQQARLYAAAMCLASSQYQLDRAANNKLPETATELLALLEHDYQVIPSPKATLNDRRRYLSAFQKITRGNRREAIEDALRTLLGADFIAYRTTLKTDIVASPASPGNVGVFAARGTPKKVFQIDAAVAIIGTPVFVPIAMLGGTEPPLIGEKFCVDPDPRRNIEQVTILEVQPDPLFVAVTFTKPHHPGTLGVRPHPIWISNQRYDTIVVSVTAASDPETRRKINELMGRALRGVSQWCIVHNAGTFVLDDPIRGVLDATPLA